MEGFVNKSYKKFLPHCRLTRKLELVTREVSSRMSFPIGYHPKYTENFLLHGNLDIWVKKAHNLPNMVFSYQKARKKFRKIRRKLKGDEGHSTSHTEKCDPYVRIQVSENSIIGTTFVMPNNQNPIWMQHFNVDVAHYAAQVFFVVKNSNLFGTQIIGIVEISAAEISKGTRLEGTFQILAENRAPCNPGAELTISIQYTPVEKIPFYNFGVGSEVPGTYFPLRKGGKMRLYQDAHVDDCGLPNMKLEGGVQYEHGNCWRDIFDAISQARYLIYITGWSVYHKVKLVRENEGDSSLGELLKAKSKEGVRVLLLVWDDPTSWSFWGHHLKGKMRTHDEETRHFFKDSSVQVLLCDRYVETGRSWVKKKEAGTIYSHHQKTVIVDVDAIGDCKRKIIAFVGGLDLCLGRYDTPKHPLFSTLQTVHKDDNYNPTFEGPDVGCPRQPWHDLHCQIDGPAAYDILTNFEQRWLMAAKLHWLQKLKMKRSHYHDSLLKIETIPHILQMAVDDDPEAWHVQLFRSIDSSSVQGFPENPNDATSKNLICGKNMLIDMSIHTAYVKAIRAAQRFIYIENQYFLGSSYNWDNYENLGANNLIPMEIALKIANKIRAKESFSAYIVIPMWPEGDPTSTVAQMILFCQHKTMQMMYDVIYNALEEVELINTYEPQDYLNFFCLGNREAQDKEGMTSDASATNTPQGLIWKSRRFMIYVHSKGMVVDDEYLILGSANINQRSLEGTRDTEIAIGAYQPGYTWANKHSSPHGQIHGYRMSLWAEHIGVLEDCFEQPESLECVRRVRSLSEHNWAQFVADEVTQMKGHLLKYPVEVDRTGDVKPLTGCEKFPDVGGSIVGTYTNILKNKSSRNIEGTIISIDKNLII